jgi:hypothetical protein
MDTFVLILTHYKATQMYSNLNSTKMLIDGQ